MIKENAQYLMIPVMAALIALMFFVYHLGISNYGWHSYTFGTDLKVFAVVAAILYVLMVSKYDFLAAVMIMVQSAGTLVMLVILGTYGFFKMLGEGEFNLSQTVFEQVSAIIIVIQAGVAALTTIKK